MMETEEKLSAKRKRCQVFEEISCHILLPPLLCVLEQVVLSDPVKSDACQYEVRSVEIPSFSDEISSLGLTKSFQQLRKCCEEAANLSDEFVKIRPRSLRRNHFLAEFKNIHLYSLNQIGRGWTPRQWSVHSRSMLAPSRNENVAEENQKFPSANEKCTGKPTDGIKDGGSSNNDAPTRKSLPPVAKKIMFRWFEEHKHNPYPTSSEKDALVLQCGIRKEQVEYWFKNARARYLRKFLDENE